MSTGLLVTDDLGGQTFISNDGTMMRFIVKGTSSHCGRLVHNTNYQRIFLSPQSASNVLFNRPLPPNEMSITTYVNIQDNYVRHNLVSHVQTEMNDMAHQECLAAKHAQSIDFAQILAEQRSPLAGETASIGNGWMVSVAGEAWLQFRCDPILVSARESDNVTPPCPFTSLLMTTNVSRPNAN